MFRHAPSLRLLGRLGLSGSLMLGLIAFAVGDDTPKEAAKAASGSCCSSAGTLSGVWTGEYRYSEGAGLRPVTFTVFLFQQGDHVTAMIKEPNSFGDQTSPWLHATAEGRYDKEAKTLNFVKSYDGTAGVSHDVVYKGSLASGATESVSGTWDISGVQGSFTMKKKGCCE